MSVLSPKKKNVYLDKVNENLSTFFRTIEKFQQNLNELSQLANGSTVHINDIERILGNNDDDDGDDDDGHGSIEQQEQILSDQEKELLTGGKLCELNQSLNISMREIRQSWNTLEKQGAAILKSVSQLPKLIQLFLDTTKTDADFNDQHFRSELVDLAEQFPIVGQFYSDLCLEIQVLLLDLSSLKSVKHLATTLEFLCSRFDSISVPLQIIRQIQMKLT